MTTKVSTLFYTNSSGSGESLELPTIQSLSIPDDTTIPSKATITGEYRNQFVARGPVKVSFTAWLEGEQYGDTDMDVSTVLDTFVALRDNRTKFNLTTTHTEEESRFLSDLVIENITFNREASNRERLVCTVNCTQIRLVDLIWQQASAIEIFGHEIFTNQPDEKAKKDFKFGCIDKDFQTTDVNAGLGSKLSNSLTSAYNSAAYESGYKQAPVSWAVKKAIDKDVPLGNGGAYYKLTDPIDMSEGGKTYYCNASFQSKYGNSNDTYTVNLGQFIIKTTKKDGTLAPNFPAAYAVGSKAGKMKYWDGLFNGSTSYASDSSLKSNAAAKENAKLFNKSMSSYPYVYDFADTYPGFTVSKTFEYVEGFNSLATYLNSAPISSDPTTFGSGNVIIKDGYIWTYKIKDRYTYSITYNNSTKSFVPDGGLRVDKYNLNTSSNNFKPTVSNDTYQSTFDEAFTTNGTPNYQVTVVAVTLGTLLQVYLFSNALFQRSADSGTC